ncbi:MAG: alpha/beta fold hydrolase [bacterium]
MGLILGSEPFFEERGEVGCLLLHGFTGTPREMRMLGDYLAERDITVSAPRICGHCTTPQDLNTTRWPDWYRDAEAALADLRKKCKTVFVAGLSMGGLQTLHLGTHYPDIPGIIPLAAPVFVRHWKLALFMPLMRSTPLLKVYRYDKGIGDDLKDPEALKDHISYKRTPTACVLSIVDYMRHVREDLPAIRMPVLVIQARQDHTVHPENANEIYNSVGSADKELVWLDNSYHVITEDYDRETVFKKAHEFIEKHA